MQLATGEVSRTESVEDDGEGFPEFESAGDRTKSDRASRWWLIGAVALALAAFIPAAFGRQVFDTKIDLTVNPVTFFDHIFNLWDPNGWFGYFRNQVQGYAFPTDPFFILGHALGIPPWLVQRFWMATVVVVAFWGIVRLAEELKIGSLGPRLAAGAAFALLPTLTALVGSVTAEAIPGVLTAWAMIPLVRASRGGSTLRGAALSAVAVLFMGGANAADTLYALIIPLLYLLTRAPSPRKRSLLCWWVVCVGLATAWWTIPLLFLGKYGFNFLPYIEQSVTTTSTSSATSALSGSSVWTAYINLNGIGWDQAGLTVTDLAVAIVGSGLMAATGLYGIARRDIRERRFLVVSLAVSATIALAAYWGPLGGPFSHLLLPVLNGPLSPLRSIYKVEPAIGLLLALGIAHSLHTLSGWKPRRIRRFPWRLTAVVVTIAVLVSLATPYLLGRGVNNDSYASIPSYWYKVADYLAKDSPRNTALVLPAASHGEFVWGWTVDEPLEALARSPWADDQDVPFGGPGSSRVVEAIELALRTNTAIPDLSGLLWRAGIKDVVVQNDLQWQLSDSPSPLQVHGVLEASGLKRVAQFGPIIETSEIDIPTLSLIHTRTKAAYPAVEIYRARPPSGTKGPISPITTLAASSAALVSGGPEAIEQLLDHGLLGVNQAAILAGDWHGKYHGPVFAVTDTLRRQDVNFGLVNDNTSYTFTATGQTPDLSGIPSGGAAPGQLLPIKGVQHQTVAVLKGAASITSSSAGSEFYYLPEYDPANVFDGQSATGWINGNPFGSVGEWIQISFNHPVKPQGTRVAFLVGAGHPKVTGIRVSTNRGSVLTHVKAVGTPQLVNVPAGTARYLRVTFTSLAGPSSQSRGAGIRTISIPGVHVQEALKPPQESSGTSAQRLAFSFATTAYDPFDVLRSNPEPVMARQFDTPHKAAFVITGNATPRPGPALDSLIGPSGLNIAASSTFGNNPGFRPQNLIDNNLDTAWVAGSQSASIRMHWLKPVTLSSLQIIDARDNFAAAPKEVLISSLQGTRLLHVGHSTTVNFAPLTTNSVTLTFPKVEQRRIESGFGGKAQAPIGLAELKFPALTSQVAKAPNFSADFSLPCGSGPPLVIDGQQYKTSIEPVGRGPSATYANLVALRPMSLAVCSPFGAITIDKGTHLLVAPHSKAPFEITALTLNQVVPPQPHSAQSPPSLHHGVRGARILSWAPESRTIAMTSGPSTYLEVHQNFNTGWTATLNGKTLTPIRLDGWQQGYLVPAGSGGTVHLTFGPETPYVAGLIVGALGVLVLALIALGLIGRRRGITLEPALPWSKPVSFWLATALVAALVFAIGGPVVLAVPVLAFIGSRRPALMPWIAFAGMVAAGIVAGLTPGTGALSRLGAFSIPAQVLSLIALSAVLVPIAYGRFKARETSSNSGSGEQSGEMPDLAVAAANGRSTAE